MHPIKPEPLTAEAFVPFGDVLDATGDFRLMSRRATDALLKLREQHRFMAEFSDERDVIDQPKFRDFSPQIGFFRAVADDLAVDPRAACLRVVVVLDDHRAAALARDEAIAVAEKIGYPVLMRPSYVLGGRAMEIVHEQRDLERYMREVVKVSNDSPVLLDRFLNDAIECDVDALCDAALRCATVLTPR